MIYHNEIQDIELFLIGKRRGKWYRDNVLITFTLSTEIVTIKEKKLIIPST